MIRQIIIIAAFLCQYFNASGQFFDDFSDGELGTNPAWQGDLIDFIVNEDGQLQLNATDAGNSQLYTELSFPDSIVWNLDLLLDFAPSLNNRLRVYLALDQLDPESASGYYIEIGENGSEDALQFYALRQGQSELLATGQAGALANDPSTLTIRLNYFTPGEWSISTSYSEADPLIDELIFLSSDFDFGQANYFMIECTYTASRSDLFFFNHLGVEKFERDKIGPEILEVLLLDEQTIEIQANESLSPELLTDFNRFDIAGFVGEINEISFVNNQTALRIDLSQPLESGRKYFFNINGLIDVNGNVGMMEQFELALIEEPAEGDLAINEILFNPETGGSDFVELINISDKFLALRNLQIINKDREEAKDINLDYIIEPGKYLCLTEDVEYLLNRYDPPDTANLQEVDLPAFNNDVGNVTLQSRLSGEVIDEYNYTEETHFEELDDLNGVSLERITPFGDRWFSASSAFGFATPGYRNSTFVNPDFSGSDVLSFENKTFSPNQDGLEDQLIIKYQFPDNGYLVDIYIFDQYGREIKRLANNELLGQQGFVLWDGLEESGEKGKIGIYFVVLEAYNVQGDVISAKKPAILADFID